MSNRALASLKKEQLVALTVELISRSQLAYGLGQTFFDGTSFNRNTYQVLGYKREPEFTDYWNLFCRGDIAKRIVAAPVESAWSLSPEVREGTEDDESPLEKEFRGLDRKVKALHYLQRVDLLSGIGRFGLLLLGVKDASALDQPLKEGGKRELLYLRPYMESSVSVVEWETDPANWRYGLPRVYQVSPRQVDGSTAPNQSIRIHHTRCLHVAEGALEDDVIGTPRLQVVLNRLQDLEKVVGGSAEMFWQGALMGLAFKADKEFAGFDQPTASGSTVGAEMTAEIEKYVHGLKRYLKLQGVDVQPLSPQVASPQPHVSVLLDLISAATHIPKRILIGSERGELASVQDDSNWADFTNQRRIKHCEPKIFRPFVDWCIQYGVLPPVQSEEEGYSVQWPDLHSSSEQEKATVAKTRTDALVAYAGPGNAEAIVPVQTYLQEFLGMDKKQAEELAKEAEKRLEEEKAQMEEEEAQLEEDTPEAAQDGSNRP